jgi:hypothetical protein
VLNRRRLGPLCRELETHAIRNDDAHAYSLLTYYIRIGDQIDQLQAAGFDREVKLYALDGRTIGVGEPCHDRWVYYAARRT